MGTAIIKHPVSELGAERQSAWMSKITNDGLTWSGRGCFIAVPIWQQLASKGFKKLSYRIVSYDTVILQIEIHGIPADNKVVWTETVWNNGFNPVWNETKLFKVTCPELALVLFRVADNDSFARDVTVAEYCLPMRCMQTGYRMIALRDKDGQRIGPTGLLVHISIDKTSD